MDPWFRLRQATRARIGLGRAGDGLPTDELLEFQLGHARARDAVQQHPDYAQIAKDLGPHRTVEVSSRAKDRTEFLLRPDLGRLLGDHCLDSGTWDLAIVIADGLSAKAVDQHAAIMTKEILNRIPDWKVAPIVLANNARVALGDAAGLALGAQMVAILIGERPGLSVPDSLGIYLTCSPHSGTTDAQRNCVSNIHPHGLSYSVAAQKVIWLLTQARILGYTGVNLKEESALTESKLQASDREPSRPSANAPDLP